MTHSEALVFFIICSFLSVLKTNVPNFLLVKNQKKELAYEEGLDDLITNATKGPKMSLSICANVSTVKHCFNYFFIYCSFITVHFITRF